MNSNIKYCNSLTQYSRLKTRVVNIGEVPMGGEHPIRIQSMTTTNTMDTIATVNQTLRMVSSGCEYVRITAPSKNDAENLFNIKKELENRGCKVPLIADIHFTPNAAEISARIVEKVRVNPGNYADRKKFETIEYSDAAYQAELERIYKRFSPLVRICKEYGTAMRIGANHGSLSDRIMSRYGDTPLGMVESALEFVRICEDMDYHNIVLSMKASNPQIMIQAYRLLVNKMFSEEMNYPIHLGVTEAGDGEDGRIKSAVGIGTLLEDGIGDTVRVSLTEDPEAEAPVAINLVKRYNNRNFHAPIKQTTNIPANPFQYNKRQTHQTSNIGGINVPVVVSDYGNSGLIITPDSLQQEGYFYDSTTDKWKLTDTACDFIYLGNNTIDFELPGTLKAIYNFEKWEKINKENKPDNIEAKVFRNNAKCYPLFTPGAYLSVENKSSEINFIQLALIDLSPELLNAIRNDNTAVICLQTSNAHGMAEQRQAFYELLNNNIKNAVIIKRSYNNLSDDEFLLYSATDLGGLLIDGFGDGIWITNDDMVIHESQNKNHKPKNEIQKSNKLFNKSAFGILQAARLRISKTEYISCPSCGRTLFDLQETTAKIRSRTQHLKGVKIGIMGCIVNGPGEMADADFGYVGTGPGKITLYKGKEIVKRNINSENAVDALIDLIKESAMWVEPSLANKDVLVN